MGDKALKDKVVLITGVVDVVGLTGGDGARYTVLVTRGVQSRRWRTPQRALLGHWGAGQLTGAPASGVVSALV